MNDSMTNFGNCLPIHSKAFTCLHSTHTMDSRTSNPMQETIPAHIFADIMGVSKATLRKWEANGTFVPATGKDGRKYFPVEKLLGVPEIREMVDSPWEEEMATRPLRPYTSIELFAGAGGLALGMERAGLSHILLNEIDHDACATLRLNRPQWNIVEQDVRTISFKPYCGKVDFLSGGFPCQAFSYAGKQGGFNDTRGTLFFELARAVKEAQPKVFMGENVKGLSAHDGGRTLETIKNTIRELGYTLVEPRVLKAIFYQVPQKRERVIIVGFRDAVDYDRFCFPAPTTPLAKTTLKSVLDEDADNNDKWFFSDKAVRGMMLVKEKMNKGRVQNIDEPCNTISAHLAKVSLNSTDPVLKIGERYRRLTPHECARIQSFPETFNFASVSDCRKYRAIGNAVPPVFMWHIAKALAKVTDPENSYETEDNNLPNSMP